MAVPDPSPPRCATTQVGRGRGGGVRGCCAAAGCAFLPPAPPSTPSRLPFRALSLLLPRPPGTSFLASYGSPTRSAAPRTWGARRRGGGVRGCCATASCAFPSPAPPSTPFGPPPAPYRPLDGVATRERRRRLGEVALARPLRSPAVQRGGGGGGGGVIAQTRSAWRPARSPRDRWRAETAPPLD